MAARRTGGKVAPDLQVRDPRLRSRSPRRVLVVGEVPVSLRAELRARGATVVECQTLDAVFDLLAVEPFDVIAVDPLVEGSGLDFVNALKEDAVEHERTKATLYGARGQASFLRGVRPPDQATLVRARSRHALTPVVVLPLGDSDEYAVIVRPPLATAVHRQRELPVATTVMRVSAGDFSRLAGAFA